MTITEKVAYLKGLAEGLKVDENDKNGKLISVMIDVLDDMAKSVVDLEENVEYLNNYIEEVDEDLGMVEEDLYCDEDEDDEDFDDYLDDEDDDEDEDCECASVECPACGEEVFVDDTMDFDNIKCPSCGAEFSCSCDSECESCGGCEN